MSEKRTKLVRAFTTGFASNLCSLRHVYYVMLGYLVALGVNWDLWGGSGFGIWGFGRFLVWFWPVSLLVDFRISNFGFDFRSFLALLIFDLRS